MEKDQVKQIIDVIHESNEIMVQHMADSIAASESRMMAAMENTIGKRIDAIFDGYVGMQERYSVLQEQVEALAERMRQLEDFVKSIAS